MNRSSTPGSPAGHHAGPDGNRARSFDYQMEDEELDEVALDPALVTSPGHGAVGVFQPPRPAPGRHAPANQDPAPSDAPAVGDSSDIDSPFLDLFGGAHPPTTRPAETPPDAIRPTAAPPVGTRPGVTAGRRGAGHEHPQIPHQHTSAPAAADDPGRSGDPGACRPGDPAVGPGRRGVAPARRGHEPAGQKPASHEPAERG
ncbi:hypothetical protein JNW88_23090, partial [Micromonospora sp. ATA32]|nr:hypothetical protein [Micromonospora sp. ATA32]